MARNRKKQGSTSNNFERYLIGGAIGVTVIFLAAIVLSGISNAAPTIDLASVPDNSQAIPIQGQTHINPGEIHPAYNSNPPTSGWHYPQDSRLGVFTDGLPDETLVHNLEHGHVWLSYRDADDQEALDLLSSLQRTYPNHVIVTYRPANDSRIAAAAWGRLLTLDELDADQLHAFIQRYRERAPENIPG
ncbi:MAG: hypothetical protein Kow0077_29810 [Anaerolineae bacterium]